MAFSQNDSIDERRVISNMPTNVEWNFIKLQDTLQGVVIKHNKQIFTCGHLNAASLTIVLSGTDTLRIIDVCNLDDYEKGMTILIAPDNNEYFGVNIPSFIQGKYRKRTENQTYTNEFDEIVETTAFGEIEKNNCSQQKINSRRL